MGGETEPTHPSTVHPPLYQKTTPISNTAEETTTPPLIPTTRPSRLPLRNPRPTSHPTGQETREQEGTPRQQIDLRARHSVSNGLESPHPYEGTSTATKTLQRCLHVLPGVPSAHPSPWPTGAPQNPRTAPCPVTATPKQAPNQPTASNPTPNHPYARTPEQGRQHTPKGGKEATQHSKYHHPTRIHQPPRKNAKNPSPDKESTHQPRTTSPRPDRQDHDNKGKTEGPAPEHLRQQDPPLHTLTTHEPAETRGDRREWE